ncbi:hypothetical protein DN052_13935 [Acidithiobacillus ferrooxidans]|uniref:Uncharacterized protein n=2 Tax=Acidithiobacillus ferrooxidans TaxID=920 RepID=A0A2W1K0S3_ACIFR|nr:hypothetical protein DN052_13935 [Acidithiobacillus ferrooxidans]
MRAHIGICRLCGNEAVLCKSHIIPAGIFRHMITEGDGLTLIKSGKPHELRKRGNGEYERLLCQHCEQGLAPYDQYGVRFIRSELGLGFCSQKTSSTPRLEYFMGVDIVRLHCFFMSLLWRAIVSRRPFFSSVDLPGIEPTLRRHVEDMTFNRPLLTQDVFAFSLLRFSNYNNPFAMIKNPDLFSDDGYLSCDIYVGPYKLTMQADNSILPKEKPIRRQSEAMFTTNTTIARIISIEDDSEYACIAEHIDAAQKMKRGS